MTSCSSLSRRQHLQQLDLTGVIKIVGGGARDQREAGLLASSERPVQSDCRQTCHGLAPRSMGVRLIEHCEKVLKRGDWRHDLSLGKWNDRRHEKALRRIGDGVDERALARRGAV